MQGWRAVMSAALLALGPAAALAQNGAIFGPAAPAPAPPAQPVCDVAPVAARLARGVQVGSASPSAVGYGERIDVTWQVPQPARTRIKSFLIGAMPDSVRLEGEYQLDDLGGLASGPGFVALPGRSRAPYGIDFGAGRTRVVIPLDADVPRSGRLVVKPFAAGPLEIEWAVVSVQPDCGPKGHAIAAKPVAKLGPFAVAAGAPRVVVQDFIQPDPRQELAALDGRQRLIEVELSRDGRYRLDIFERRYRVLDRSSGAKVVERSGVKPRFSPDGRFVVASIGDAERQYPTDFEVIDLVAGEVVAKAGGPIIGWSNGDALLLDGGRAYQKLALFNTLIDPVYAPEGHAVSWPTFFPGCGTCDPWASSNIRFDWERLAVLRGDAGAAPAMSLAVLAEGRQVETSSFGDQVAGPLEAKLRQLYGHTRVPLARGWTGPFKLTHVGRGFNGYADDDVSLKPSEKGRPSQIEHVAKRRIAITEGRVLSAADLQPAGTVRGDGPEDRLSSSPAHAMRLDKGYIADELAKLGLKLTAAAAIEEEPIPRPADWEEPVVRPWPEALKSEVSSLSAEAKTWFKSDGGSTIIVGAWRLKTSTADLLLVQHGDAAQTINGAHQIRFDILETSGPNRGRARQLEAIGGLFSQYVGRQHTLARVHALGQGRIVVVVPSTGTAVLVDPAQPQQARPFKVTEPTLLCGFYEDAGGSLLVQSNCDGQLFVLDPARGAAPIVSGRVFDAELLLYSPEGFYTSTYEGAHFVHVAFPGLAGVHSFEQFAAALERPDVIRGLIEGKEGRPEPVTLAPPPNVSASVRAVGSSVDLDIKASAVNGLAAIDIYEDGGWVAREPASGGEAALRVHLKRRSHVRTVTVIGRDRSGFRSRPATVTLSQQPSARGNTLHVVAVGIDAYEKLSPLAGARFDAETLAAAVKAAAPSYYKAVRTTLRVDREATADAVQADLKAAIETASADDTILVFFAGHGAVGEGGRYFLTTTGSDPERLGETSIDWQSLARLIGSAKARVVAIVDACHSGQTGLVTPTNEGAVSSLADAASAPIIVLAASKGRQFSEEVEVGRGGVFTQSLVRQLTKNRALTDSNRDGVLTISEVYRSLKSAVESQTGGRQSPWLVRRNVAGDAPLF